MAYFRVLLLLFLLPIATAETSDLLKDLESYKSVMDRAADIKKYIEQFYNIINYMKERGQYLVDKEKAVLERIGSGLSLGQEGLEKAAVGVTLIKEQLNALLLLLDPSIPGTQTRKSLS